MASITTWQRLEPRSRTSTLSAVRARVYDPAWLLARQRQLAEWRGEDAGSAVRAELAGRRAGLSRYRPGGPAAGAAVAPFPTGAPLEAIVEGETGTRPSTAGVMFAARAGECFLRSLGPTLGQRYRADYVERYELGGPPAAIVEELDDASRRVLEVLVGRVPDGLALYAELATSVRPPSGAPALPQLPAIDTADAGAVLTAAKMWLNWVDTMRPAPRAEAWDPAHLEHVFSVAAPMTAPDGHDAEVVLTAAGYADGHLDWHAFDVDATATLGAAGPSQPWTATAVPTPVRFPGMPSPRWWELEDGATNFGAIDAAPDDLARLALLEFVLVYANDFLEVPMDLPVGSLCRIDRLTVTNTFGERLDIDPVEDADGGHGPWSMFRLSALGDARGDFLLLAPTVDASLHGGPIEEVLLARDEMANVAWAIEQRVQTPVGTTAVPRERADDVRARAPEPPAPPAPSQPRLVYRLATEVPDHWHALVPVTVARTMAGVSWNNVALEVSGLHPVQGDLLRPVGAAARRIAEEEVPRTGVVVTRGWQRARWVDGTVHTWVQRRKRSGRGEGSSGLRYDVVEDVGAPAD
jgi:hypothetical protein